MMNNFSRSLAALLTGLLALSAAGVPQNSNLVDQYASLRAQLTGITNLARTIQNKTRPTSPEYGDLQRRYRKVAADLTAYGEGLDSYCAGSMTKLQLVDLALDVTRSVEAFLGAGYVAVQSVDRPLPHPPFVQFAVAVSDGIDNVSRKQRQVFFDQLKSLKIQIPEWNRVN
jgi:hypothetical protein